MKPSWIKLHKPRGLFQDGTGHWKVGRNEAGSELTMSMWVTVLDAAWRITRVLLSHVLGIFHNKLKEKKSACSSGRFPGPTLNSCCPRDSSEIWGLPISLANGVEKGHRESRWYHYVTWQPCQVESGTLVGTVSDVLAVTAWRLLSSRGRIDSHILT